MVQEVLLYAMGLGLASYIAWSIGANDASNSIACTIGSGVLELKKALLLFSIFAILGASLQGFMVMKTLDRGIVPSVDVLGAFTITLATGIWITFSTWKGMPISTSHSIVGAVVGYGILKYGVGGLKWGVFQVVLLAMLATPILSFLLAFVISRAISRKAGPNVEKTIKWALIGALCFAAFSFGANDVGNATGIFSTVTSKIGGISGVTSMLLLAMFGSFWIVVGGITWGHRVIETQAKRITRLTPTSGFSAQFSNGSAVYLFTTLPYLLFRFGIPVSTSHSSVSAIMGAGVASGAGVHRATCLRIIAAWCLTLPVVILLSFALYALAGFFVA